MDRRNCAGHRIVQDLLVKNADATREVSKIAEDSRQMVDRISLMGVDDPKYGKWLTSLKDEVSPSGAVLEIEIGASIAEPNFKKLSGDLRGLNDEVNGVTKTQFSELRKHILDSVHDEVLKYTDYNHKVSFRKWAATNSIHS